MKSVAFGICVFLTMAPSRGDDAAVKKAIQARYTEICRAFEAGNTKVFEAGFTPDFEAIRAGRPPISRADILKDYGNRRRVLHQVHWSQTITSLKSDGKTAHVVADSELSGQMKSPEGAPHQYKLVTKGTKSVWVKGAAGWQMKSSEAVKASIWIDGKPI